MWRGREGIQPSPPLASAGGRTRDPAPSITCAVMDVTGMQTQQR